MVSVTARGDSGVISGEALDEEEEEEEEVD